MSDLRRPEKVGSGEGAPTSSPGARQKRRYLRFVWNHEAAVHRFLVRIYYAFMRRVPVGLKYGLGAISRRRRFPYVVARGRTVVQIGAPRDTLEAGRSRGVYLVLLAGRGGRVIVIEPDPSSVAALRRFLERRKLPNTTVVPQGAWCSASRLHLYVDPLHPATSFTEGAENYDAARMKEYQMIEMEVDTVDHILQELAIDHVDLVRITTNGAEKEILDGLRQTIGHELPYIPLADTGAVPEEPMFELGYRLHSYDDRGRTYMSG